MISIISWSINLDPLNRANFREQNYYLLYIDLKYRYGQKLEKSTSSFDHENNFLTNYAHP